VYGHSPDIVKGGRGDAVFPWIFSGIRMLRKQKGKKKQMKKGKKKWTDRFIYRKEIIYTGWNIGSWKETVNTTTDREWSGFRLFSWIGIR
jgi:hypothetical protein